MKNTVWSALLGAFVRWLLALIAGRLMAKGVISEELSRRLVSDGVAPIVGALLALGVLLWSMRVRVVSWIKFKFALDASPNTPAEVINARVKELPLATKIAVAVRKES